MEEEASSIRSLRAADAMLSYGLFRDSARTRIWGGTANSVQVVFDGSSNARELTELPSTIGSPHAAVKDQEETPAAPRNDKGRRSFPTLRSSDQRPAGPETKT